MMMLNQMCHDEDLDEDDRDFQEEPLDEITLEE